MSTQLDLFRDNRRTILQHDIAAHLEGLQLAEAFDLSTDLLQDEPADPELLHLTQQISAWQQQLIAFNNASCSVDTLFELYHSLAPDMPKPLIRVRKRMRQLNPEMFARYMDKIGKKTPGTV